MGKIYQVLVRGPRGENVIINLCDTAEQMQSMTVLQLKEKIAETLPDARDEHVRLIFLDKMLDEDSALLSEYGIQHMSIIHLVLKMAGGGGHVPVRGDGGMGDKDGKNRSMEKLSLF